MLNPQQIHQLLHPSGTEYDPEEQLMCIPDGRRDLCYSARYASYVIALKQEAYYGRACAILERMLALQNTDETSHLCGLWSCFLEEDLEKLPYPDFNVADFIAKTFLDILYRNPKVLSEVLKTDLIRGLRRAIECSIRRNIAPDYTNISIISAMVIVSAGELLEDARLFAIGKQRLKKLYDYTCYCTGFSEYNSHDYALLDIEETTRMLDFFRDPECRAMAETLNFYAWDMLTSHFNASIGQLSPPQSRAYIDLENGRIQALLYLGTDGQYGKLDDLRAVAPPWVIVNLRCPESCMAKLALEWIRLVSADAIVHAYRQLREATVRFGVGEVDNISYIREYILDDGTVRTNPNYCKERIVKPCAEPDKKLPLFFFTDADGKPMGSIANFALHHDIISGTEISSDYSGVVSRNMKKTFGSEFVSMFFAGFCGNINHANYMGEKKGEPFVKTYEETGDLLYAEMMRILAKAELLPDGLDVKLETVKIQKRQVPEGFVDSVKDVVKNPPPFTEPFAIDDPYSNRMKYAASARVIEYYGQEPDKVFDVPVQVIKLGDCLIWALPGEVFCQFADKLRSASPTQNNMFVELANHTDSPYIPTREMFLPYVYESTYYSARFEPDAGDIMTDKAIALANTLFA